MPDSNDTSDRTEDILVEFDGGVCTIIFNRARKKNAFSVAMYSALVAAFTEARARADVRVILMRGTEGVFTAGNDLSDFMSAPPQGTDSPVARFIAQLVDCEKPVLAAVEGPAIGIGATMLLHCDLVYAGESARFHMPFVNLGLTPEAGSSYLLPRLMGYPRAAELLLIGEPFSAQLAHDYGFVNQVLADEAVIDRARCIAELIAKKPPAAVRAAKALMRGRYRETLDASVAAEYEVFAARLRSPEAAEAFQAFFQRREPDFSPFE